MNQQRGEIITGECEQNLTSLPDITLLRWPNLSQYD